MKWRKWLSLGEGYFQIDGTATIREINKATKWELPLDGPKTMNGLVLEQLESIPDGNLSLNWELPLWKPKR